jgi:hypothetical protein
MGVPGFVGSKDIPFILRYALISPFFLMIFRLKTVSGGDIDMITLIII